MLKGRQLVGSGSRYKKPDNDFYATNPDTVRIFLDKFLEDGENIDGKVWECACGNGNISKVLREYKNGNGIVKSSDIVDRGYHKNFKVIDFLDPKLKTRADVIITNPPFSLLNDFITQGLRLTDNYLIFLAKIQTLETQKRGEILKNSPLKFVYVNTVRQATWHNGNPCDPNGCPWGTTMCLCWFVWKKGYKGEPIIRFL